MYSTISTDQLIEQLNATLARIQASRAIRAQLEQELAPNGEGDLAPLDFRAPFADPDGCPPDITPEPLPAEVEAWLNGQDLEEDEDEDGDDREWEWTPDLSDEDILGR